MKKNTLFFVLLYICIIAFQKTCYGLDTAWANQNLIEQKIEQQQHLEFDLEQRNIIFQDEGYFYMRRIDFKESQGNYYTSFSIPGTTGTLTYFDTDKNKVTIPLVDGPLPLDVLLIIETPEHHMILGQAYQYRDLGRGTKQSYTTDTLPIYIEQRDGYWEVIYRYKYIEGNHGILWGIGSNQPFFDLTNEAQATLWSVYDVTQSARLAEDGYYYKSPNSYIPTHKDAFWRNPSMYLATSFIKTGGSKAADMIGQSLLLIATENLEEEGYFKTLPESSWLKNDYDIDHGFFDTRFNGDIGDTYLEAYKKFGNPIYREMYLKMGEYYLNHVKTKKFVNWSVLGEEGWLVQDYHHEQGAKPNHSSLNHQLHAINWFLRIYEVEQDLRYEQAARKMIQGIKNIRDRWIMPDGNLEYAYMPDDTMGLVDYPYLTYNDLLATQKILFRIDGEIDSDLEILVQSKKEWMDRNHIQY